MLTRWYEQQNPALIDSSQAEVISDIRQISKWMYSNAFVPNPKPKKEVVVEQADIDLALKQNITSVRKLLFLFILLEKAGMNTIGAKRLGEIIGVSRMTIHKNLNRLEKEGAIIRIRRAAIHNEDGSFYQPKNIYRVCDIHRKKTHHDNSGKNMVILVETLLSSFSDVYEQAMLEMTVAPGNTHPETLKERLIE